jgi:hypothetical protein
MISQRLQALSDKIMFGNDNFSRSGNPNLDGGAV